MAWALQVSSAAGSLERPRPAVSGSRAACSEGSRPNSLDPAPGNRRVCGRALPGRVEIFSRSRLFLVRATDGRSLPGAGPATPRSSRPASGPVEQLHVVVGGCCGPRNGSRSGPEVFTCLGPRLGAAGGPHLEGARSVFWDRGETAHAPSSEGSGPSRRRPPPPQSRPHPDGLCSRPAEARGAEQPLAIR